MVERRGRGEGTYQARGKGVYRLRVYVGRDPITGRPRQASRTVKAANDTEARKALRRFVGDVEQGRVAKVGPSATVGDLLQAWLAHLASEGRAQTTIESYTQIVERHLVPAFGTKPLAKLTAHDLDAYYQAAQAAGVAPRSVRLRHAVVSSALAQACRWEWIDRNVARNARPPKLPRGMKFIPKLDQVRQLIGAAEDDIELAAAVALAAITGARRGELCGLRWPDWDPKTGTLLIERQRARVKGGVITTAPKVGDGGRVALGEFGTAVLVRYRSEIEARAAALRVEPDWTGWLLSGDCGRTPMDPKDLGDSITALGKRAGVPVTTHAFRRFAATYMLASGVDVRTAAGRLRHTPEMLLRVYAGFVPSRDEAAAELLSAAIGLPGAAGS